MKLKLYSKNLNTFLAKYDPDSFGLAPTLTKLAEVVTKYLDSNKDPLKLEQDLKPLFDNTLNNESNYENNFYNSNKNSNETLNNSAFNKADYSISPGNEFLERNEGDDDFKSFLNTSNSSNLLENLNNKKRNNNLLENFSNGISPSQPFANTRSSNKEPSYAQGIQPQKRQKLKTEILPANPNRSFTDQKQKPYNKYKNQNRNPNKSGSSKSNTPNQKANGVWKTKRFF